MKIKELIKLKQYDAAMRLIKITDLTDNENLEILAAIRDDKYINIFITEKPLITPPIYNKFIAVFRYALLNKKIYLYNYLKKYISNYIMTHHLLRVIIPKQFDEIETDKEYKKIIYSLYLQYYSDDRQVKELLEAMSSGL